MKTDMPCEKSRAERIQRFLLHRFCRLGTTMACLISLESCADTNKPLTNAEPHVEQSMPFDSDVGLDATWAAEKKLIGLFKAEGFIMLGGSYKDGTWTSAFRGTSDGAKVDYEYVPG